MANASKAYTVSKAIQLWQNKNHTHEVDYDAVVEFIKKEKILPDIRPITEDEQLDSLVRKVVRTETWKTAAARPPIHSEGGSQLRVGGT